MRFYPVTYKVSPYLFITTTILLLFLIKPDFYIVAYASALLAHYLVRVVKESLVGDWKQFSAAVRYFIYGLTAAIFHQFNTWESFLLLLPLVLTDLLMDHDSDLDYNKMQIFSYSLTIISIGILYLFVENTPKLDIFGVMLCGTLIKVFIERYIDEIQSFYLISTPVLFIVIPSYVFSPQLTYLILGFIPVLCETHNHIKIPGLEYHDPDKTNQSTKK